MKIESVVSDPTRNEAVVFGRNGLRIAHTSYDDACSMGTVHSATQMLGWQGHHFSWRLPTEHPDEMIFPADCFSDKALSVCSFAVNSRLALTASSTRG